MTIASLDPAYLGVLEIRKRVQGSSGGALYKLGFTHIRETAEGAAHVTKAYERLIRDGKMNNIITTSCTAINELVEKYYTNMIPYMAPIVSPMTAHAMMLKEEFGGCQGDIHRKLHGQRGARAVRANGAGNLCGCGSGFPGTANMACRGEY